MKKKILVKGFLFFLTILFFSSFVFAIQGSDSSGTITSYSGTTGAAAASGSSSDNTVSGGRVSAGGSAVSSAYSDGTISGNPGADLSTSDPSTSSDSESGTETDAESGLNSVPSGGGGGGGGGSAGEASTEAAEATTEQTAVEAEASQEATETTEASAEAVSPAENAVTVAIELSEGSSVTLAPQTGAAGMSVVGVTATTVTVVITRDSTGNIITGGAIYQAEQEITMEVGQTIDVDSDGDDIADLQVTLTQIKYNTEKGRYEGVFTLTYLSPTEEIVSFVKEQIDRGEVAFVKGPSEEEISFGYWIWILVACIVISVLALVGWVLFDKKNKKHFPTTIPTHYFEKLIRQEVSTHKKPEEQKKEITKTEIKTEKKQETGKEQPIGTPTILSEVKQSKKKNGKRKKNKKAARVKKKKKAKRKGKNNRKKQK